MLWTFGFLRSVASGLDSDQLLMDKILRFSLKYHTSEVKHLEHSSKTHSTLDSLLKSV